MDHTVIAQDTIAQPAQPPLPTPRAPRSLRTNFSWTFVGNVVYAACQWGMLVVLAKLGSPEMVGQFALSLAVTAPITLFANLQLRNVQATDATHQYRFEDYFGLRLITTMVVLVVLISIVLITRYRWETAVVILVIGVAKAFEAISDVFYGLFQQHEQMDRVATSMIVKGLVSLLVVTMAVFITGSIVAAAIGLASVWALLLVSYDAPGGTTLLEAYDNTGQHTTLSTPPFINIVQPRWHAPTLMKLTKRTLPLGLAGFLVSLNPNIPRYFVERLFGERELGIFAAMAYILVVGNTVVSALAQAANPRLATYYAAGHMTLFRTLLFKLVGVGVTLGCIGTIVSWFAGREILVLVYGIEYGAYASVFVWLMVAAGIGYVASFLTYAMLAARVVLMQLSLFVVVTCITLVCCLYLLPVYGLLGGAWALMIGFSIQAGGAFVILQRAEHTIPSS